MAVQTWEQANAAYLGAGLDWLRDVLTAAAETSASDPTESVAVASSPAGPPWWDWPDDDGMTPALELLVDRFELSRFESLLLLLCAAMELDPATGARCARASGDALATAPTFALALRVLPDGSWDVVSPHRPLRFWRLIEVATGQGLPLTQAPLRADERIVNFIKGLNGLDERLGHLTRRLPHRLGQDLTDTHEQAVTQVLSAWRESPADGRSPIVELVGADPRTRRQLAAAAADRAGLELLELPVGRLPTGAADVAELLRLLDRESALLPLAFYLDLAEQHREGPAETVLADAVAPVLVGAYEPWPVSERRTRIVDAHRPTVAEQRMLWLELIGADQEVVAGRLADNFDLDPVTIRDCAAQAEHNHTSGPVGADRTSRALWDACRDQTRPRLSTLARRIEPDHGWSDLVLPEGELRTLHQLADQVRGRPIVLREWALRAAGARGLGITALFAGQSGTGKTLAAEVLASELNLALYRVDLSGVVSKYIGETERNLRLVFDAAEEGGALLFFDEADALFGKRTEVRDSHDRYANIEVNYLLQRMEDYRGLAILATNRRGSLDSAFLRRLRYVVTFPFPSAAERHALWIRAFPIEAPVENLDLARLSDLPVTGGMIRNIALNAMFCAAGRGETVDMPLVMDMARSEFGKLELPMADHIFTPQGVFR